MLNTILHPAAGPETAPPLLIAHGLYGSGRNWGVIARRLADQRRVIAIDHRNHGESPWRDSHGYPDLAADIARVADDIIASYPDPEREAFARHERAWYDSDGAEQTYWYRVRKAIRRRLESAEAHQSNSGP